MSVGRSVGLSVCNAFVRRSTRRTFRPTWPCLFLEGAGINLYWISLLVLASNQRNIKPTTKVSEGICRDELGVADCVSQLDIRLVFVIRDAVGLEYEKCQTRVGGVKCCWVRQNV